MLWVVTVSGFQVAEHVGGSLMEGTYYTYLVQADLWRSPVSEYFEWPTEGRRAIKRREINTLADWGFLLYISSCGSALPHRPSCRFAYMSAAISRRQAIREPALLDQCSSPF